VIIDRVLQARVVNALEPEWEARFEPKSYGFRPGRGCHDAIEAIFQTVKGRNPRRCWVLDADLKAAFDQIDHQHLLTQLGDFPACGMVADWLKAGVMDQGRFAPTEQGTPQGGVVSPLLLNIALHGMEAAAGVRYRRTGTSAGTALPGSPVLIRYADDLVAMCHSREQAIEVKARLAAWLAPRGLAFNEDKTRIVHVDSGFDFLGVQRPPLLRQAADQTQPGSGETDPGPATGRDAGSARSQRSRCTGHDQPDRTWPLNDIRKGCGGSF
jgi:RNA-directed DNA polymerase